MTETCLSVIIDENHSIWNLTEELSYGILDLYVNHGSAPSNYNDRLWKVFYEKGAGGNK